MAGAPIYPGTIKNSAVQIANADASTLKTLLTPATLGSKVVAINAASDDTSARDVQLVVTKGGVDYPLCTVTIPITAGTIAATTSVNLLDVTKMPSLPIDRDGQRYLLLETGSVLKVKSLTTVTSAKLISVVAVHADF